MRVVVIFAVAVVVLMAYADKLYWLQDIDFTTLFGYLVVLSFLLVLGFRFWEEYWRPKKSASGRLARRAEREKQFDQLDELEAERALEAAHTHVDSSEEVGPDVKPEQLDLLGFTLPKKDG